MIFPKKVNGVNFAVERVSIDNFSQKRFFSQNSLIFPRKSQNILNLDLKNIWRNFFLQKKTFSSYHK